MADGYISQVKLPSGGIYEIKDKWAREQIAGGVSFVVCSSASDTPIGVTWTNGQGQTIQGTLKASEAQRGTFYLVPAYGDGYTVDSSDSSGDQSHFDEYVSAQVGSTFMWERLGRKDIDLTNYLRVDDAAATYLKKATDEATGVHTYSYAGEAIKVTGSNGAVVVGPISNNSAKVTASTLTMQSTTANDKAELTKDSLKIYNGNATPFTVAEAGTVTVQSATSNDKAVLTKDTLTVYNQSTSAYTQVGQTAVSVQSSANAKTTVGTSSVKVQADATQNVTVGTTKVTITGCSSVTSEWNKDELKFTPATAGQTMEVKSDGTIVKKTGDNGATTNTYSFNGDFNSNDNAVVRKSELVNYVGGVGTYVQKAGDTMTGSLTVSADSSTANHVRVGSSDEHLDVDYNKLTLVNNCGQSTPVELTATALKIKDSCGTTTLNGADTASIVHTCGSGTSAVTHTYSFKGDFSTNDNAVVRKSDLGTWATASSGSVSVPKTFSLSITGTVPKNPTGGTATVHTWKLGTETTKNVTFTELADSASSFQLQPKGTVSKPSISVATAGSTKTFKGIVSTFSGSTVVASMNAGSWSAGSWSAGSWSAGSYTAGSAFSQGTLPALTMTMDTTNTEQLNISFSQGTLPSYTPPTCTLPTCTLPTCTLPTCTLPTVATTATLESITAKTSDASYQLASTPTFTGKKYTVTSAYPGALTTDSTESATVTLTAASGTDSVTFGTKTISIDSREDRLVTVPAASGAA